MDIKVEHLYRCTVIHLDGHLDHLSAPVFDAKIAELQKQKVYRLIINAEKLNYISSAGLRSLLAARKLCRRYNRGNIHMACMQQYVLDTFELTGAHRIFVIYDTLYQAVGSF